MQRGICVAMLRAIGLSLLLSGCYAPQYEYFHEDTQRISSLSLALERLHEFEGRGVLLVPDFHVFAKSNPYAWALVNIYLEQPASFHFQRAVFTNMDTGFIYSHDFNQVIEIDRPFYETNFYRGSVQLLDANTGRGFMGASRIEIKLTYALNGGIERTEVMTIRYENLWKLRVPV